MPADLTPRSRESLRGRVVAVTGAGSGIGRAIACDLATHGARIVVADINDDMGRQTVDLVRERGAEALFQHCDVADPDAARELVEASTGAFGRLDAAVNNAGITRPAHALVDTPDELWETIMRVNLTATFTMLREQLRYLRDHGGGSIVNIASMAALQPVHGTTSYATSKAGVVALTRQAALEHVDDNIRVNAIAPGVIRTPIFDSTPAERMAGFARMQPGGRLGEPEEIASATTFLLSDLASFITGQVLSVDMGAVAF